MPSNFRPLAIAALATTLSGAALAQATIDQTKALAGSVTPGDAPGFPITINQPGHYVLKGNLSVPAGTTGIEINAPDVTLDLNGFRLQGPVTCSRNATTMVVSCNAAAVSEVAGIRVGSMARAAARIQNGTVAGFAGRGIHGIGSEIIDNMTVRDNAAHGYAIQGSTNEGSHIRRSVFVKNGGTGIAMWYGVIEGVLVADNGEVGIDAQWGTVLDSYVRKNRAFGVLAGGLRGSFVGSNGGMQVVPGTKSMGGNVVDGAAF